MGTDSNEQCDLHNWPFEPQYSDLYFVASGPLTFNSIADVRSHPYSRYMPHFSREFLKEALSAKNVKYVFLGRSLGARSDNPACYHKGKVQYDLLAQEPQFIAGLDQLRLGMNRYRIALMCAEKDPLNCHRAVLVARKLYEGGISVVHIHADGSM